MDIIDDEIIAGYIEESREHLADIESDLLTIEEQMPDMDRERVNKVFRAAHSIKGGAGFLNFRTIKGLSHGIENVLDLMRNGELAPSHEVVNVLLRAFDTLRDLVNNYKESEQADISRHVADLARLTEAGISSAAVEVAGTEENLMIHLPASDTVMELPRGDLECATRNGATAYLLALDLIHDVQRLWQTPLDLIRTLDQCGCVLECRVAEDMIGTLDDDPINCIPFYALLATELSIQELAGTLQIAEDKIIPLGESANPPETEPLFQKNDGPDSSAAGPLFPEDDLPVPAPVTPRSVPPVRLPTATVPTKAQAPPSFLPATSPDQIPVASLLPEATLRINVSLLDTLMNLAGELVLSRNQLLQAIQRSDQAGLKAAGHRINSVTSELQETIMLTRMQPIGTIFNRFTRVVRDLARDLGKEANLAISGKEVELDKTIIEGLSDPLTHLIRNAVDHGIESPAERRRFGKPAAGSIQLHAFHEAGQVIIEISDDGRGISPAKVAASALAKGLITPEQVRIMSDKEKGFLILLPGFSTAERVTDISGRGVGMDVVKTNIEKLNGLIDIESEPGRGSVFRIKLPLTLAIIPCLFVATGGQRYAIPQVSVVETIRIAAAQVRERIERVGDAEVLLLRGSIIPIIHLARTLDVSEPDGVSGDLNLVVVSTGIMQYGMVVQHLHDSEEIVVKPLGRHVRHLKEYAGATIMGDGRVALILDVSGLAQVSGIATISGAARAGLEQADSSREVHGESRAFLTFFNGGAQQLAVPLELVERIEKIAAHQVETVGGRRVMQYRGQVMPLMEIGDVVTAGYLDDSIEVVVIVFAFAGREIGLLANTPVDSIECVTEIDRETLMQPGIVGSVIFKSKTVLIVDIATVVESLHPDWFLTHGQEELPAALQSSRSVGGTPTILLAEDSDFFRDQIKRIIEEQGYGVVAGADGALAWEALNENAGNIRLVVTDIEMPTMDGLELTRKIKADTRFRDLPVISLSSLAGDDDIARGVDAGVTRYLIKLDRDELIKAVDEFYPCT